MIRNVFSNVAKFTAEVMKKSKEKTSKDEIITFHKLDSEKEKNTAFNDLKENIDNWYQGTVDFDCYDKEQVWKERKDDTGYIMNLFQADDRAIKDTICVYYRGKIVGLMALDDNKDNKSVYVALLVTHPGSSGLGGLLLEKAANASQEKGYGGKVRLETWGMGSTYYKYRELGMKQTKALEKGCVEMTLSPDQSHRWSQDRKGKWHILCNFI